MVPGCAVKESEKISGERKRVRYSNGENKERFYLYLLSFSPFSHNLGKSLHVFNIIPFSYIIESSKWKVEKLDSECKEKKETRDRKPHRLRF